MPSPTATTPNEWHKADAITGKSDGDTVNPADWPDSSGNGNHFASGTGGIYKASQVNSLPCVRAASASSQYYVLGYAGDVRTALLVYRNRNTTGYHTLLGGKGNGGKQLDALYIAGQTDVQDSIDYPGKSLWVVRTTSADPNTGVDVTNLDGRVTYPAPQQAAGFVVLTFRYTNSYVQVFVNGALVGQKRTSGTPQSITELSVFAGYFAQSRGDYADADLCELAVYATALSDSELANLNSYATTKYAITSAVASSFSAGDTLSSVFFGNAIERQQFGLLTGPTIDDLKYRNVSYYPAAGEYVTNPSIAYRDGTYWLVHDVSRYDAGESPYPYTATSRHVIASSTDAATWTKVADVDMSGLGSLWYCWAPELFFDPDGAVSLWGVYSLDSDKDALLLCRVDATDTDGLTTWGTPATVTVIGATGMPIDPFLQRVSGSNYVLWYAPLGEKIGFATASSRTGTYTEVVDGTTDAFGWAASIQSQLSLGAAPSMEGPSVYEPTPGTTRVVFDAYSGSSRYGEWYSDSTDFDGTGPGTWSTPQPLDQPLSLVARHGTTTTATESLPLASGTLSFAYATVSEVRLTWTDATGGATPYTYNLHRAPSSGFTPSSGNRIGSNVSSPYDDATASSATLYRYKVVTIDAAAATVTSNEVTAALPYDGTGGTGGISRARLVNGV